MKIARNLSMAFIGTLMMFGAGCKSESTPEITERHCNSKTFEMHIKKLRSYADGEGEYFYKSRNATGIFTYTRNWNDWKFSFDSGNGEMSTEAFVDGHHYIGCRNIENSDEDFVCNRIRDPETINRLGFQVPVLPTEIYIQSLMGLKSVNFSERNYAGRKADCFDTQGKYNKTSRVCFDCETSLPVDEGTMEIRNRSDDISINAVQR